MIASALLLLVLAAGCDATAPRPPKPPMHPLQTLGGTSQPLFPVVNYPPSRMNAQFDTQPFSDLLNRIAMLDAIVEKTVVIGKPKHLDADGFWNGQAAADDLTLQNKQQIDTFRNDAATAFRTNQTAQGKIVMKRDIGLDLGDNMLVFLVKDIIDDHANE